MTEPTSHASWSQVVERLVRDESTRLLATLIRILGDFQLAEDVVQDALIRALETWPATGVPENPRAWVVATARNRAIDRIRRAQRFREREQVLAELASLAPAPVDPEARMSTYPDDQLRLLFTCCHPALSMEARVGLTLRTVGGLSSTEIARAFLIERTTLQQRLVRARKKIQTAGIPYEIPDPAHRSERLDGVLAVVYLVFNEGYAATEGPRAVRVDLAEEAIRLGRLLLGLCPDDPEVAGLLALMCLHHSRRGARTDAAGDIVLLEDQERSRWDPLLIEEGLALVEPAVRGGGSYGIQAAISALHARAARWEHTDWAQIAGLYEVLLRRTRSPVVAVNHAVAVAMAHGPEAGLTLLEALPAEALARNHLFHAARAGLLERAGRSHDAALAYETALQHVGNEPERRFLAERLRKSRH